MHAWSEVEHDLAYKPLAGDLSEQEYAILDQLNGLVIAGEIGLETLQKALETRVASSDRRFATHYDLAIHLLDRAARLIDRPISDAGLGRVDLLFDLITMLNINTPALLAPYLESLHDELELRPLVDQVIDSLLIEDPTRYEVYSRLRAQRPWGALAAVAYEGDSYRQVGFFMAKWIELEALLRKIAPQKRNSGPPAIPSGQQLRRLELLSENMAHEFDRLRRMRNNLVHGIEAPEPADLEDATRLVDAILRQLRRRLR